ncbi:MAG: hypothetical protein ABIC40_08075 [bacterium]
MKTKRKNNRIQYKADTLPAFVFMHVIFFLVQFFFFWIYFYPTPFTVLNIPVIYFRIQQIGYPTVLICSLVWLNTVFFPGESKYILISIALFIAEWFAIDRIIPFIGR